MMDLDKIKDLEKRAVELWEAITERDLSNGSYSLNGRRFESHNVVSRLRKAMELDPTGISTLLIMRHVYTYILDEMKFTVRQLIEEKEFVLARQAQIFELHDLLFSEDQTEYLDGFTETLIDSIKHYGEGVSLSDYEEVYEDGYVHKPFDEEALERDLIGFLRLDALIGMDVLQSKTFLEGEFSNEPVKFNPVIYQFMNIQSAVKFGYQMPNGISLIFIRAAEASDSYFCFLVRNGENVSILTDKMKWAYPGQGDVMRSRNDRHNIDRMGKHHFPYYLLGLRQTADGKSFYETMSDKKGIVEYQNELKFFANLSDVYEDDLAWIAMMFDLIGNHYYERQEVGERVLTANMIVSQDLLEEERKHLPIKHDDTIVMPKLKIADVSRESMLENGEEWEKTTHIHKWLEDKYGQRVSDNVLAVLPTELNEGMRLIPKLNDKGVMDLAQVEDKKDVFGRSEGKSLATLDLTEFGTREELIKDFRYVARKNYADAIEKFALKDWKEQEKTIYKWYKDALRNNQDFIFEQIAHGVRRIDHAEGADIIKKAFHNEDGTVFLTYSLSGKSGSPFYMSWGIHTPFNEYDHTNHYICPITDGRATLHVRVGVKNALALAQVTAQKLKDMPDFAADYEMDSYNGNSILSRLDPMDDIYRAWDREANYDFKLSFSKRGFNQLRKKFGLKPLKGDEFLELFPENNGD